MEAKKRGRKPKVKVDESPIIETTEQVVEKPQTKGVVIFALGSVQYGRMAANLAASMRVSDKEVNIHLFYTPEAITHLTDKHKNLFTSMQLVPKWAITKNGKVNYLKAKTCIYDLTPYDETIMIDADVLWFGKKTVSQCFAQMRCDFTMQSRGFIDGEKKIDKYTWWGDTNEMRKAYDITGKIHQLSSEFVYFKKTQKTKELFSMVREVYESPKVASNMTFMGDIPDELAYNIATSKLGIYPRKDIEVFIHWAYMDNNTGTWESVVQNYYGMSIGGNNISPRILARYHTLARGQARVLGLPFNFNVYPKRQWDSQRKKL